MFKTQVYDRLKKIDESIKFKEKVKVYIFVAQWLDSLSVNKKGIYFTEAPRLSYLSAGTSEPPSHPNKYT